jgi:acyl-CoA synthetase (AMP-forming)/AMP-acid ligase II
MMAGMLPPVAKFGAIEDVGRGVRWDAATLATEVARRAERLSKLRLGRGQIVAITHGGSAPFFADLLATWATGAAAACLDSALTAPELETVLSFLKPAALLASDTAAPIERLNDPEPAQASASRPDDPALILFTSGTTGAPKGVVLSFQALSARMAHNRSAIGEKPLARTLVTLPTHFGHGLIGNALTPLLAGGDIVLHPPGLALAQNLGRIIDDHRISFMSSVPAFWRMALKFSAAPRLDSLLRIHVGSAPLSGRPWSEIASWSRAEVVNCYGMTETANWIAGASSATAIADGLVGRMWGGVAAVADDQGVVRPAGEGEIVVQPPSLMSGYLYRPDLTAAAIRDGWFRTGDYGTVDECGEIRLTGRIKDEINRAGFKVQPGEIDTLLEGHPAIVEACTFAIADPVSGEAVAAAVKLAAGARETPETLRAWCSTRLRREAIPERWFFVAEIPRTERGKVSRDAIRRALVGNDQRASDDRGISHPR